MDDIAQRAIDLASELAAASAATQTSAERSESAQMARMMSDEPGKAFTLAMVDRVFRSPDPAEQAQRLQGLLDRLGTPRYLPAFQRFLLKSGSLAARALPQFVMPEMENELRRSSARVILAGEPEPLHQYLARRKAARTRVNLNHLGEAVLGEEEATHRLQAILDHLADSAVDYISVKISAIFSQVNIVDWDRTLTTVKKRLRTLYRAAGPKKKFVNLDMEEYRDLEMTVAAFTQVLDEPEFKQFSAGLALQGYIPDSWQVQQRVTAWAMNRVATGGAPIKIRLVKGANLAMEKVEAELHGWFPAPYTNKADTDANYRRMLEFGCQTDHARAANLGVASHNLFDVALGLVLREQNKVEPFVELEMLEGMVNHQARAVQEKAGGLLVYAPAVKRADFISAMAYLVRRLDENTHSENFLHDLFGMTPGSPAWDRQKQLFINGWEHRHTVADVSHRLHSVPLRIDGQFQNASDSDWTQPGTRAALMQSLKKWRSPALPSLPALDDLLSSAVMAQKSWDALGYIKRSEILQHCAAVMEEARFDTIAQMLHEGKKAAVEGDGEVSEAVDYARYFASVADPAMLDQTTKNLIAARGGGPSPGAIDAKTSAPVSGYKGGATFVSRPAIRTAPLGVVVVTPPWNFPYAIPAGGVLAALAAGNSVVLKPAPETVGVAYRLTEHLWKGGVPRDALQFYPCADGEIGQSLIIDPRVSAVVLTGAYDTAKMFLSWRPSLKLFAETSGKNAVIITHQADRDLAIKDLVKSAFGHAGQKCSAASLAIVQARVYDDPAFRRALCDAAASLKVGPTTDPGSIVTPLIREPAPPLLRALTTLDAGEEWLLQPQVDPADPCLWSPGIKLHVKPGSWFHMTECFGPVLGLMRAENLTQAIEFQNATPFGLTGGIHSLDDAEIAVWKQRIQVGNAYINRAITGAIVQRQPFGGWKKSCMGPGAKAGGPNYTVQFAHLEEATDAPPDYRQCWDDYFSREHDPSELACESNQLRYRPCRGVVLRLEINDAKLIERAKLASAVSGAPLHISLATQESEAALADRLEKLAAEFLRTINPPGDALLTAAYAAGLNWINAPLLRSGRHELPRWLREQAISQTKHRYGLLVET